MKRAPWLVVAGAVAGFLGVVGLHKSAAPAALASSGSPQASQPSRAARTAGPHPDHARRRYGGHGHHPGRAVGELRLRRARPPG